MIIDKGKYVNFGKSESRVRDLMFNYLYAFENVSRKKKKTKKGEGRGAVYDLGVKATNHSVLAHQ